MVLAPPRVSKVVSRLQRGLYPPALGQSLVRDHRLALDPALLSTGLPLGGPTVESLLAVGFLCSSSPSWASVAWGLSWVLVSSLALPSWVSSWAAVPWIHPLPHQALVLSISFVVVLGLLVCPGLPPALYPRQGRLYVSGLPSFVPLQVQSVHHLSHPHHHTGAWLFDG